MSRKSISDEAFGAGIKMQTNWQYWWRRQPHWTRQTQYVLFHFELTGDYFYVYKCKVILQFHLHYIGICNILITYNFRFIHQYKYVRYFHTHPYYNKQMIKNITMNVLFVLFSQLPFIAVQHCTPTICIMTGGDEVVVAGACDSSDWWPKPRQFVVSLSFVTPLG